ncbi:MAG: leucine-rich repeat domain-containing protein, partial [Prevotellamassilia sp.]|nr:leucine-rich repeat domain-containing protein [Prevotellamassilia sp.]
MKRFFSTLVACTMLIGAQAQEVSQTPTDTCLYTIETQAQANTSGVLEQIGVTNLMEVTVLKVKGTINSYDIIIFRDKMPNLETLDLSEAKVVASTKAFYDNYCTGEDDLSCYAFHDMDQLRKVRLPKDITYIGDHTFYNCDNLEDIEIPLMVETIGVEAFDGCQQLKKVVFPESLTRIERDAFEGCYNLNEIVLPKSLIKIGTWAFNGCNLTQVILPPHLATIGEYAFSSNHALTEIRIPSSVETIENNAFSNCYNLNKVYTYTVEPTTISEETFDKSVYTNATLYVPSVSLLNYFWDTGWKRFLNLATFDEPYDYFYVNNDYTLNDD